MANLNENKKLEQAVRTPRNSFFANDLKELDRDLTPEQRDEWNAIYASYQSKSILSGTVIGVDEVTLPSVDSGAAEPMLCLTIVQYRVKVLIPEPFIWCSEQEHASGILSSMVGAKIDYIVQAVDREGNCAVASREAAGAQQRWHANTVRHIKAGDRVNCSVLAVGPSRLTLTAHGYDVVLTQAGLSHSYLGDLRGIYHAGQELAAVVLEMTPDALALSVRDAQPNPFEGAEERHPIGSTRMATITGKYAGGIFCRLPDGCTVVCKYAQQFTDDQFHIGDTVIIKIEQISVDREWLRGKIRSKVG